MIWTPAAAKLAERDQLTTRSDPRFVELRTHVYSRIQKAKLLTK